MSNAINKKKKVTLVWTLMFGCNGIPFWIHTLSRVCSFFGNVENKYAKMVNVLKGNYRLFYLFFRWTNEFINETNYTNSKHQYLKAVTPNNTNKVSKKLNKSCN